MKLTPHQKIMRAAKRGTGLRLSADEVRRLSADDAISTCANNDDERARNPEAYELWQQFESALPQVREAAKQRLIEMGEIRPSRPRSQDVIHFGRHRTSLD